MTYRARRSRLLVLVTTVLACSALSVVAVEVRAAAAAPDLSQVNMALARVASGLVNPVALAWRSGDSRLYVAEQRGRVRIVDSGVVQPGSVLTVSVATGGEQGLLGLAFSLDGTKLYVDYVDPLSHVRVVEYTMSGDTATNPRDLLSIDHPLANHNGGEVMIGPDGYLYIGSGDGGGTGDNAQNVNVLLGKILRIDPTPSASLPYTIPPDNPFVGMANHREEIWMYGLRNPWRFGFDRANGDLYIADVGQSAYEEIDYALPGQRGTNWGWNLREGFHPYNGGAQPPDGVDPLFEAAHTDGYCAIIGGYVYRGSAISNLGGGYVYGDLCRGVLSGAVQSGGAVTQQQDFSVGVANLTTFGEDPAGELYIANLDGNVYRLVQQPPLTVSIGDKAMLEGNTPTRSMSLKVTLSQPSTTNVTVNYAVAGNDAIGGLKANTGADFKSLSGTLVFKVGTNGKTVISKSITVTLFGDAGVENDETLSVTLSNPQGGGYALGRNVGTGTILNDDGYAGGSQLGIGDASIVEANIGMQNLTMPVSLSTKLATKVTVHYAVTPVSASRSGTASGGGDYGGKTSGTLTFPAGTALTNITIPIWPDLFPEPDESFTITLSSLSGTGVTMLRATGTGTILAL
jgi:glucose/arabinose dehydrogenase